MKKLVALLIMFLGINFVNAKEGCNSFYKVNLGIEGKGIVREKYSDKEYTKDSTINIKCTDKFLFEVKPEEGYKLDGVYINGNHITPDEKKVYGLYDAVANSKIKVTFIKKEEAKENEFLFSSYEDNISLYIADLKEELGKNDLLKVVLREITILFDKEFVLNSKDNITIVASEVYKDDLGYKQQKAAKNALYYNFEVFNGEKIVNDLKGTITIKIPYSKSAKAYVYKVDKNGKLTLIENSYDKEHLSFKVKDSGIYAISSEKLYEMEYLRGILNADNQKKLAIIGLGFAVCIFFLLLLIKRRK